MIAASMLVTAEELQNIPRHEINNVANAVLRHFR